jgi:hypothetical protein
MSSGARGRNGYDPVALPTAADVLEPSFGRVLGSEITALSLSGSLPP